MREQAEVIAFLSRPESYGVAEPVQRIDTHAAVVFLAGPRAYKLKRAVTYLYLDYGEAEQRRRCCEAELALNRRTAPRLYLEVRAVNRDASGALTFGPGEAVDWLVVMRRFDQERLLDRVVERGELTDGLVRRLADAIAAFHAKAELAPEYGGANDMAQLLDWNRDNALSHPDLLPRDAVERLDQRSREALSAVGGLLDARRAAGRVRLCHGDLHLANICMFEGEPTLFDGIEFSRRIASTDVLYDLAFLLMDLRRRGEARAANLAFNRYLDRCDPEQAAGMAAMPLFLATRAGIRAHVRAAGARRQPVAAQRRAAEREAGEFLEAAIAALACPPPKLLAIGGLSGTGKSTLAQALAPGLGQAPGARILRSDVLRKRLAGLPPEERLPERAYTPEANHAVHAAMMQEAEAALRAGSAVVADAVFARPEERSGIEAVAGATGAPFAGLWLEAPQETLETRLAARTGDASDAGPEVLRRQTRYDLGDLRDWSRVASETDAKRVAEQALTLLNRKPGWAR